MRGGFACTSILLFALPLQDNNPVALDLLKPRCPATTNCSAISSAKYRCTSRSERPRSAATVESNGKHWPRVPA
jgi:hypothetical protein